MVIGVRDNDYDVMGKKNIGSIMEENGISLLKLAFIKQ
jgi:hypothetical protein